MIEELRICDGETLRIRFEIGGKPAEIRAVYDAEKGFDITPSETAINARIGALLERQSENHNKRPKTGKNDDLGQERKGR